MAVRVRGRSGGTPVLISPPGVTAGTATVGSVLSAGVKTGIYGSSSSVSAGTSVRPGIATCMLTMVTSTAPETIGRHETAFLSTTIIATS